MKVSEIRQMNKKKLTEELAKTRREKAVVKFHVKTGQQQDTAKVSKLKKKIAQIKTVQKEQSKIEKAS